VIFLFLPPKELGLQACTHCHAQPQLYYIANPVLPKPIIEKPDLSVGFLSLWKITFLSR
jgi:hypothetical protein